MHAAFISEDRQKFLKVSSLHGTGIGNILCSEQNLVPVPSSYSWQNTYVFKFKLLFAVS